MDMPRGCLTVMEAGGYAVRGLKHCVRPMDLAGGCYHLSAILQQHCTFSQHTHVTSAGKSAALILRHINPAAMAAAKEFYANETVQMLSRWSMKDAPLPLSLPESPVQLHPDRCSTCIVPDVPCICPPPQS